MTGHHPRLFADDAAIRRVGEGMIACALPRPEWTHEAHIATCVWLVLERPDILPERDLPDLIRRYNESVGAVNSDTEGYHETITQGVHPRRPQPPSDDRRAGARRADQRPAAGAGGAAGLAAAFLFARVALLEEARLGWVEPDLLALT